MSKKWNPAKEGIAIFLFNPVIGYWRIESITKILLWHKSPSATINTITNSPIVRLSHPRFTNCVCSSNESVAELQLHFQRFLGPELNQGTFTKNGERTIIKFQASKAKIQTLEKVIHATQQMTARLNWLSYSPTRDV